VATRGGACVLEARAGASRLLITGDVGREVERALLLEASGSPVVLVAGHHGSRTSSGPQFVSELAPRHVVFSAGRDNPFGHPADAVVRRFRQAGSCLWNTAHDGALTLWLGRGPSTPIQAQRHPPWRHGGVGDGCLAIESPHEGAR
jgi:competence protein ComEC